MVVAKWPVVVCLCRDIWLAGCRDSGIRVRKNVIVRVWHDVMSASEGQPTKYPTGLHPRQNPPNTIYYINVVLMLDQRRRRWNNDKPTYNKCILVAGIPAITGHSTKVASMLGHCLRCWLKIEPALCHCERRWFIAGPTSKMKTQLVIQVLTKKNVRCIGDISAVG